MKQMHNSGGVTLVELLVGMFIAMILMGSVYMAVNVAQRSTTGIERKVTAQQDVKPALDLMAMEVGMAGYNPNYSSGNWVATACGAASSNQSYKGIQQATTTTMTVEMDINENCTSDNNYTCMTGTGNPNEIITYNYDTANSYITRETNCGGAQPFLGDTAASGNPRTVLVVNNTAGLPVFRYYDGTGTEIAAPVTANIPNIRRIEITLAVETADIDPNTGQRRRLIYTTSVIPRNNVIIP